MGLGLVFCVVIESGSRIEPLGKGWFGDDTGELIGIGGMVLFLIVSECMAEFRCACSILNYDEWLGCGKDV